MRRILTTKRRRPSLTVAALAIAVVLAPAPGALAADFEKCKDIDATTVSRIRAAEVGCSEAREIARRYNRKIMRGGTWPENEPLDVKGYKCKAEATGEETYKVRCRNGTAIVKFNWGV